MNSTHAPCSRCVLWGVWLPHKVLHYGPVSEKQILQHDETALPFYTDVRTFLKVPFSSKTTSLSIFSSPWVAWVYNLQSCFWVFHYEFSFNSSSNFLCFLLWGFHGSPQSTVNCQHFIFLDAVCVRVFVLLSYFSTGSLNETLINIKPAT